jgi:hypothetical protein
LLQWMALCGPLQQELWESWSLGCLTYLPPRSSTFREILNKSQCICCPLLHLFAMVSSFKSRKVNGWGVVFSAAGKLPNAGGKTTVVWW